MTALTKERIILGIDPGTQLLGFGIIKCQGKKAEYVDMGVLDLRKEKDAYVKLKAIYDCISEVCKNYNPTELAIESPFYGKNAQVVLKLGRAQGAAMIAALEFGVQSVTEYAPRKAKEVIVGNGAASKEQVQMMLEKQLGVKLESRHLDATDALAIALCHHFQTSSPLAAAKGKGGWEQFIKNNPDRIKP
ncbi:MAG: crossover junction endodeoxyribonuclease RuvC [Bacteroidales bacterium]|nr:crossover junction endodeoxyribonuclease RuvC [Bacteroidales bacterium]